MGALTKMNAGEGNTLIVYIHLYEKLNIKRKNDTETEQRVGEDFVSQSDFASTQPGMTQPDVQYLHDLFFLPPIFEVADRK